MWSGTRAANLEQRRSGGSGAASSSSRCPRCRSSCFLPCPTPEYLKPNFLTSLNLEYKSCLAVINSRSKTSTSGLQWQRGRSSNRGS